MKKGDSTEMEVTAAHARCPVASVVSGVVGVSGGGVEGRIRVFRAQRAPVPYNGRVNSDDSQLLTHIHCSTIHTYDELEVLHRVLHPETHGNRFQIKN